MAAAALSGSRVAGGLYFLFTLLCLLCLASSQSDNLKNLKADIQKVDQNIEKMKARMATFSELMDVYEGFSEPMMALLEKFVKASPEDIGPIKEVLDRAKSVMEHTNTWVHEQTERFDAGLAELEAEHGYTKNCLKAFEEYQAQQ